MDVEEGVIEINGVKYAPVVSEEEEDEGRRKSFCTMKMKKRIPLEI